MKTIRSATLALALVLFTVQEALAQPADISQFSAKGTLQVQTLLSGEKLNIGGNINLFRRASLIRIDLTSLGIPGVDPALSAMIGQLVGAGGVSAVYDTATGAMHVWSNANHSIYERAPNAPSTPPPTAATAGPGFDPLTQLLRFAAGVSDLQTFNASIALAGKNRVAGHPTSGLDLTYKRQPKGGALEAYQAHLELADDLNQFPLSVRIDSQNNKSGLSGSVQLSLSQIDILQQSEAIFAAPVGYRSVNTIGEIFRPGR